MLIKLFRQNIPSIRVIFKDNKIWEIDMQSRNKLGDDKVLEDILQDLFNEYENSIGNIDFRVDTERLKMTYKNEPCVYEERQMNLKGINIHSRTNPIVMAFTD